ncbi:MAG: histidine kinase [Lachnospiraceae bacterium]
MKINTKFTIVIVLFVICPMLILSYFLFDTLENATMNEMLQEAQYDFEQTVEDIEHNIEAIEMSTQIFITDTSLSEYIAKVKTGEEISALERLEFYQNNISYLEQMVYINPDIYQVRVYVKNDTMIEMMPILYRYERMYNLSWSKDTVQTGWKFGYEDTIFEESDVSGHTSIMSLVTPITETMLGQLALLEVCMEMETFFARIYDTTDDVMLCFVDEQRNIYTKEAYKEQASIYMDSVADMELSHEVAIYELSTTQETEILVCASLEMESLNGSIYYFGDTSDSLGTLVQKREQFLALFVVIILILIVSINFIVKNMLRGFYRILESMEQIKDGDFYIKIITNGKGEMGALSVSINQMVDHIRGLMQAKFQGEMLVKNSEIKSLQNQINAHFIYNVLESIKMMAEIDEKYDISDAITDLGSLLRYSMKWLNRNVTIEEELDYVRHYLSLMNLRNDYEIVLETDVEEGMLQQEIPKMSLQPIVENAIFHGIEDIAQDSSIRVVIYSKEDKAYVEITDSGRGMEVEKLEGLYEKLNGVLEEDATSSTTTHSRNGIGLKNVQDRIVITFGSDYGIQVFSEVNQYTKVQMILPKMQKK